MELDNSKPDHAYVSRELNYEDHKKITIRKDHFCYNSGNRIEAGTLCESTKMYPTSIAVRPLKLNRPVTFYKCGHCGECTH